MHPSMQPAHLALRTFAVSSLLRALSTLRSGMGSGFISSPFLGHNVELPTFQANGSESKPGVIGEAARFILPHALSSSHLSSHLTLQLKTSYLAIS